MGIRYSVIKRCEKLELWRYEQERGVYGTIGGHGILYEIKVIWPDDNGW
jgi:hypothetical protein